MFQYKPGEYVFVKKYAYNIESPNLLHFNNDMKKYCGFAYKIREQVTNIYGCRYYTLEGCHPLNGHFYYFDECWLEPAITIYDVSSDFICNIETTIKENDIIEILKG